MATSNTLEFKKGVFNITFDNPKLDDAQFIMLTLIHKFGILNLTKDESSKPSPKSKESAVASALVKDKGILIGNLENAYGEFEFYINGIPRITNAEGVDVGANVNVYKEYLVDDKLSELNFDSKSYITVLNKKAPQSYYGVFYSLGDAIKIASENELVKTGVITS
jgi:hypothetical protein